MARKTDVTASIGRYLKKNEKVIGASRATPRGSAVTTAVLAGAGAAAGYTISTIIAEGALSAALGGGVGVIAGITIASVVAYFRMRKHILARATVITLVLTPRRLLLFRQSWFANRVAELIREIPIESITSIVVGKARMVSPHPVTITLADESVMEFEAAKVERPGLLADAFRESTGA